jgi:type IV pilus assembly protein PilP
MKKIKYVIFDTFIIFFIVAIFSFAAEVKNNLPAAAAVPAAPAATSTQIQKPPVPPAVNAAPAAAPTQIQKPPVPPAAPAVAPTQIQQQPLAPTSDNYSYNPSGKPDPFRPFIVVVDVVAKQQAVKKAEVSMFPLQRAETEKYNVVGIAGDKDHRIAIAQDAAKKFYPLFIGTHIGIYDGKVIEIMADRVIVEEYENKKAKRVILKLRKN